MSNKKHPKCKLRSMASDAKKRLVKNEYSFHTETMSPPKDVSPSQKVVYLKLRDIIESGEELINPIQQLADKDKLKNLSHEEKQRYILQLSADYVSMKRALDENIKKSQSI